MTESKLNFICFGICILSAYIHFFTQLDIDFQKHLFLGDRWLIAPDDKYFNFIFYKMPKVFVVLVGVFSIICLVLNKFKVGILSLHQKICFAAVLLTLIFYPILINLMKDILRQPCPRDLRVFGGDYDSTFLNYLLVKGEMRCFPGAHASAPFSLLALKYFFEDHYNRALFLMLLIPISFLISFYQVFRGVHFLTDIIFTAALSQIFVSFIYHYMVPKTRAPSSHFK